MRLTLLLSLVLFAPGCASLVSRTVESAVHGGLEAVTDQEGESMLNELLADPRVPHAAQRLAQATLQGTLAGLTDEEQQALMRQRSEQFIDTIAPAINNALRTEIGPALRNELAAAVSEATRSVAADPNRQEIAALASAVSRAIVDTLGPRLRAQLKLGMQELGPVAAEMLDKDLGPALRRLIAESAGPGLQAALQNNLAPAMQDHLNPALTALVRSSSAAMLDELNIALAGPLGETMKRQRQETLTDMNSAAEAWMRALGVLATFTTLGMVAALTWLRRTWVTSSTREQTLELLTGVIKEQSAVDPTLLALVDRIRETGKDSTAGNYLTEFLDKRKHLKVRRSSPGAQGVSS